MTLTLRKTRFSDGTVYDDDYIVVCDGQDIGRILKQPGVSIGRPDWFWGVILPGRAQPSDWRGNAATFDDAKAAFAARWDRIDAASKR